MTAGDWIALAAFGLTGFGMFCTLIGVVWHWASRVEKALTVNGMRLDAIERVLGIERQRVQLAESHQRIFRRAR